MKKLFVALAMVLLLVVPLSAGDKKFEPQKFQVTYKITYNSMTLEEAAEMEKVVKATHKGACSIKVTVEERSCASITISDSNWVITPGSISDTPTTVYTLEAQ